MAPIKTLILTALLPEAQALKQGMQLAKVAAPVPFWAREEIGLALIGVQASRLPKLAQLQSLESVQGVLMAGLAGALAPDLAVGDVIVGTPVPAGTALPKDARIGAILCAERIVATAAEKERLFASTGCMAVDMEAAHARRFAEERRAAFLTVRGISDAAKDALDPAFLHLIDDDGNPRIGRAIAMLCRHPSKLAAMLRLQRASSLALSNLAAVVQEILASGWPGSATDGRQSE